MSQTTPVPEVQYTDIRDRLRQFVAERDWAQFHTPKNLASALTVEAAELLEIFQWLPTGKADELDEHAKTAVRHEMADVLNYLVMLADALEVDLFAASMEKIVLNAIKYPVEQAKGDARKYTAYEQSPKTDAV
ncbi:nucleotide pyrophosphohydrolase [Undibacterium sp. KW1]|uniref:nucleotide pyrophosphohydrolase n=1 Tax=Undibacterium sp. KW1 TaxID=2058624 RepID=UPI001331E3BE|nr:nucleotide pyrophosphohydrolase [Undibacterium sp. KW1]BBB61579.1 nucleotide pyrophosphohydrolase [Undibacterium sp. KW1]